MSGEDGGRDAGARTRGTATARSTAGPLGTPFDGLRAGLRRPARATAARARRRTGRTWRRQPRQEADEQHAAANERREPADDEQCRGGAALDRERPDAGRSAGAGGGRRRIQRRSRGCWGRLAVGRDQRSGSASWAAAERWLRATRASRPGRPERRDAPVVRRCGWSRRGRRGAAQRGRRRLAALEVLAAPRAQRPVEPDEAAAVRADAVQPRPAGRADDPFLVDPPVAGRTVVDRFDLGEEGLLGQVALPHLADLLVRPDDLVDPHGEQEEERGEEDDPARRRGTARPGWRCAAACRGTPSRTLPARRRRGRRTATGSRAGRPGSRRNRRSCRRSFRGSDPWALGGCLRFLGAVGARRPPSATFEAV